MNAQQAVDAPRFHHQWLPDQIQFERGGLSTETMKWLRQRDHTLTGVGAQGAAEIIVVNGDKLEAGIDRRASDSGAAGW
jgi:gamma-glutamyltranspeptidase/glutathione hydrolase